MHTLTCPRHVEGASEVGVYHSVPAFRPDICCRRRKLTTPVVHKEIEAAESIEGPFHGVPEAEWG